VSKLGSGAIRGGGVDIQRRGLHAARRFVQCSRGLVICLKTELM
jgi:hypothetical protein